MTGPRDHRLVRGHPPLPTRSKTCLDDPSGFIDDTQRNHSEQPYVGAPGSSRGRCLTSGCRDDHPDHATLASRLTAEPGKRLGSRSGHRRCGCTSKKAEAASAKWRPNRRPSDYESKSLRPAGAIAAGSGCSRQAARPASAFLTCRVTAGGMTRRMTVRLPSGSVMMPGWNWWRRV